MSPLRTFLQLLAAGGALVQSSGCGSEPEPSAQSTRILSEGVVLAVQDALLAPLELIDAAIVEVVAVSNGAGTLTLTATRVDTAGSKPRATPNRSSLEHESGELRLRLPLPDPGEDRFALEVRWDGSAPLSLTQILVHEVTAPERLPVIWINVDTLAARHSNVYGYARETTPYLARLAEESVVFEHCRANAPWTLPSTISQLTGVLPLSFRMPDATERDDAAELPLANVGWQIPAARWTLAELLDAGGYETAAFIDNPYLHEGYGVAQGFGVWDTESAAIPRTDPSGGLAHMTPRMLAWLETLAPEASFFLFLQPFDPHGPYVPAPENAALFANDGVTADLGDAPVARTGAPRGAVISAYAQHRPGAVPGDPLPERVELGPLVDSYDRSIRTLDDALGKFVEALRERGVLERAVLVISADHGENTVDHEALFEHKEPWESVLHIPLLIRLPGGERGGSRIDANVQGVDIFPTIAELAGLTHDRAHLDGLSLVPALRGEALPERDHFAYAEEHDTLVLVRGDWKVHYRRPHEGDPYSLQQLREVQRWREQALGLPRSTPLTLDELLIRLAEHPNSHELIKSWRALRASVLEPRAFLFDLSSDPGEFTDRSIERAELADALRRAGIAIENLATIAREDAPLSDSGFVPDAELLETLRDLGYGGDG